MGHRLLYDDYRNIGNKQHETVQGTWYSAKHCLGFLAQRIRDGFMSGIDMPFPGPVEADETCSGGKRKNMSKAKRAQLTGRNNIRDWDTFDQMSFLVHAIHGKRIRYTDLIV